jgi:hypothetical protein
VWIRNTVQNRHLLSMILGDEIVDEALGRQEAANFANRNRVQVPRRTLRCSTCLTQTEGTKAKNSLKKVSYCSGQCCGTVTIFYGSGSDF